MVSTMVISCYYVSCIFTEGLLSSGVDWVRDGDLPAGTAESAQEEGSGQQGGSYLTWKWEEGFKEVPVYFQKCLVVAMYLPACLPVGLFFPQ